MNLFTRLTSIGAAKRLALSFHPMEPDRKNRIFVVPPLLRQDIFYQETKRGNYIHGYMVNAGFADDVCQWHCKRPDIPLRFAYWVRSAGSTILNELQNLRPETFEEHMYMVEEFV